MTATVLLSALKKKIATRVPERGKARRGGRCRAAAARSLAMIKILFFRRRAGEAEAEALFVVNDRDDVNYFCLGLFLCIAEPSVSEAARRLRPPNRSPVLRGGAGPGWGGRRPRDLDSLLLLLSHGHFL